MNSIRPLATVAVLFVIGIGLYMVINTSEPVPPEEAQGIMLDIPQIEDDFSDLLDEGAATDYDLSSLPPFAEGGELTDPPTWTPPPTDDAAEGSYEVPVAPGPTTVGMLPQDERAPNRPSTEDYAATYNANPPPGGNNPFSTQLERQVHGGASPQEITNPHAANTASAGQAWGDIPSASAAGNLANSPGVGAPTAPVASTPFSVARSAIDPMLRQDNLSQALLMLSEFCGDPQLTPDESTELNTLLSQLAGTVIYSTEHRMEPAHRVQAGESLEDIAARFQVSPELLAKINGLASPAGVAAGSELKVVRGPFHAVVEPGGVRLMLHGRYAGRFAASGPDHWTTHAWTVQQKADGGGTGAPAAAGEGKQILLTPEDASAAGAIATISAGSPTPNEPRPAVYVSAQDLNDLYDILTVGSRVTIRR